MGTIKEIRVDIPNNNHLTQVIVTVETIEGETGYGEAWWGFSPPPYDNVTEVRVIVRGAQCDALPVWSETYM